jgi:oligoribonuclease
MPSKPLNFNNGPLVWIDCEMTGLDTSKDKIIEIAVRVSSEQMICVADDIARC